MPKFSRRMPGTGSVFKRSDDKHRRKPWMATITLGLKKYGKRDRVFIGSFATKKEALDALDLYRLKGDTGLPVQITVGQVWDYVVKATERQGKKMNRNYRSVWNCYVSRLADMYIGDVKALHLQDIVDGSGLKGSTQQRFATVFHMIYDYAIANDLAVKDYSKYVKYAPIEKSTLHQALTTKDMRILWSHTDVDIAKVALIQCYTGLRPTELATIELDNVHLTESYMTGGMKTAAGRNRTIPIADCIKDLIAYFYNISRFKKYKYLIMPDLSRGLHATKGYVHMGALYNDLQQLGVNHLAHDARHTFVTLCDNYGVQDTLQKLIVGHSFKRDVTKGVYTHKILPQLLAAVNSLPHGPKMTMTKEEKEAENGSLMVV